MASTPQELDLLSSTVAGRLRTSTTGGTRRTRLGKTSRISGTVSGRAARSSRRRWTTAERATGSGVAGAAPRGRSSPTVSLTGSAAISGRSAAWPWSRSLAGVAPAAGTWAARPATWGERALAPRGRPTVRSTWRAEVGSRSRGERASGRTRTASAAAATRSLDSSSGSAMRTMTEMRAVWSSSRMRSTCPVTRPIDPDFAMPRSFPRDANRTILRARRGREKTPAPPYRDVPGQATMPCGSMTYLRAAPLSNSW
jgi:hypothetical protein